jgi:hypothetical protein
MVGTRQAAGRRSLLGRFSDALIDRFEFVVFHFSYRRNSSMVRIANCNDIVFTSRWNDEEQSVCGARLWCSR